MTKTLLLISIGPIQDFIASARKCQDLWFGSWLLSDLARAVAEKVRDESPGPEPLIFPAGLKLEEKPAVANKIMAIISSGKEPKDIAEAAKKAMDEHLEELADQAFDPMPHQYFEQKLADAQLKDLMEFIWVSVRVRDDLSDYAQARDRAEALLAARKNTKDWSAVGWHKLAGAGVPKSSLDGIRESVIHEDAYNKLTPEQLRKQYLVKPGERLCGVGLLKRAGTDETLNIGGINRPAFHSTSHVASTPILTRMEMMGTSAETAFQNYLSALKSLGVDTNRFRIRAGKTSRATVCDPRKNGRSNIEAPRRVYGLESDEKGYDGYILFENRLPELLTEYCPEHKDKKTRPDDKKLKRAREAHRQFRSALRLREGHTAYYAYLLADGDRMGKAIDVLSKTEKGIEAHRKLGESLERFSASCQKLAEKAGGSLIYAGGDDVLALCPLHTALSLARALRDEFEKELGYLGDQSDELKQYDKDFEPPTLSVGIGVCHHMASMERARELAKIAEKKAKDDGRNSLAIALEKRSGGLRVVSSRWGDDDECIDKLIYRLAGWLESADLPHGFSHELERMLAPFTVPGTSKDDLQKAQTVIESLALRILGRKRARGGDEKLPPELEKYLKKRLKTADPMSAAAQLSNEIQIAGEFLRSFQDAFDNVEMKGGNA